MRSTLRLVRNPKHKLPPCVVRLGLSLCCNRFAERQNFRHDRLDFPSVDQARDLGEVFGIWMN